MAKREKQVVAPPQKAPVKQVSADIPDFIRVKKPPVEVLIGGKEMEDVLKTWLSLQEALHSATLEEAYSLLYYEATHARRPSVLSRIFGRYNKLRYDTEWRYFREL